MKIADRIREQKDKRGITTEQLSELSGVPVGTINKILSGETKSPRYDTIDALETAMSEQDELSVAEQVAYMTGKQQGEYTLDDYYNLPEDVRAELIDGELIILLAPSIVHQVILTKLLFAFEEFIESKEGNCIVLPAPTDVRLDLDNKTMVEPDIVVICDRDKLTDKRIEGAPNMAIEIVSDSSRKYDYRKKMAKYAEAGVEEYWIVDPKKEAVITYFFREDDIPCRYSFTDKIPVQLYDSQLVIDFSRIKKKLDSLR